MTDARIDTQDDTWRLGVPAAAAFALASLLTPVAATLLVLIGVSLLIASLSGAHRLARAVTTARMTAITIALALAAMIVPQRLVGSPPWVVSHALPLMAFVIALTHLISPALTQRLRGALAAALVLVAMLAGSWLVHASRASGFDIVLLHEAAAAALARGENPYGSGVTVPNGAPGVPAGSMIVGYPYPPVAALMFATSTWITGNPRWLSLACWMGLLASLLYRLRGQPGQALLPVLLLAAFPGWPMMLQSGWTELLSAAFLALAATMWRNPLASGVALGCALGSKQYFLAMLPALLRWREGMARQSRVRVALLIAVVTLLPMILWNVADAWRSLATFHVNTPLRADSQNIVGVLAASGWEWAPPAWLAMLLSAATIAAVPPLRDAGQSWRGATLALAVLFLFARQAMPNYWYLVAVTALLGSLPEPPGTQTTDGPLAHRGKTRAPGV